MKLCCCERKRVNRQMLKPSQDSKMVQETNVPAEWVKFKVFTLYFMHEGGILSSSGFTANSLAKSAPEEECHNMSDGTLGGIMLPAF